MLDAAALVVAVLWLRRPWSRPPRGPAAHLAAGAALGLAWLVKLGVLGRAGVVGFGVMHVLYLDLFVALPVGGAVLVAAERRRGRLLQAAGLAAVLLAPVGAYASFVEPSRLSVERVKVPLEDRRAGRAPVRVGVVADIQFRHVGRHERRAVDRVTAERPDLIVLPGDVHQGSRRSLRRELPAIRRLMRRLRAPGGVYLVPGDAEDANEARQVAAGTGVRMLVNQVERVLVRDRWLAIGGTELDYRSTAARRMIARLEQAPGAGEVRLLLAHRPDAALTLRRRTRIDLVVAGHTHGGQVNVPGYGPPVTASRVGRRVAAGGLHGVGGRRRVYVSRGVGLERGQSPRVRFLTPPEISLFTLR